MSASQAGYSGTPLVRKVGVKAGHLVVLCAAPDGWVIPALPAGVTVSNLTEPPSVTGGPPDPPPDAGRADVVVAFCRTPPDLTSAVSGFARTIHPAGALWIAWPRRAAGHHSDVTENLIREVALPRGLVDIKVAALDTDWSGLKVVWRKELR
ncbi:DUF3052 family protein [Pseudofrankia asymbiotica]|uniref:DUF3052 domain-containing protein n=1 Tax=Pseudofrankia asymbiotica TaxID=1834516 RepID=A0A1V2I4L2_9ACTN|nr:DUF3052 family protein [Pseudofrankia asymbiotica]ONH25757.1 DUF3052 domain-containing protein [Pseudofrankia asymbiotica]